MEHVCKHWRSCRRWRGCWCRRCCLICCHRCITHIFMLCNTCRCCRCCVCCRSCWFCICCCKFCICRLPWAPRNPQVPLVFTIAVMPVENINATSKLTVFVLVGIAVIDFHVCVSCLVGSVDVVGCLLTIDELLVWCLFRKKSFQLFTPVWSTLPVSLIPKHPHK